MRIAICDHNDAYLNHTKRLLYCYAAKSNYEIYIETYKGANDLIASKKNYSLIFLNTSHSKSEHIEIISKIKQTNPHCEIIFMSASADDIFEAFKIRAFRFLLLPTNKHDLFEVLNDFFNTYENENMLLLKKGSNTFCLNIQEILYLEANNKHCAVHMTNETLSINKTMAKIYETIPQNAFCRINKAFIINLRHIKKYNNEYIELFNDEVLPLGRTYLKSFKEKITEFINIP